MTGARRGRLSRRAVERPAALPASATTRSPSPSVVPLKAVAALFLERQHLRRPRARPFSPARLVQFVADAGGLQLDSINVIDRAHYLTVWSRFGPYDKRALDRLAYGPRRRLFEYWAHAACLVPTEHFPSWRRAMLDYHTRSRGWARWLKKNRATLRVVEEAIQQGGPLGSADFVHRRRRPDAGWWNWKPTTHALDYLWMSGRTLVETRQHFQKRFNLAERVMPDALAAEPLTSDAFHRWHLRRSLHAMGAATEMDLRMYLSFPRVGAAERRRWLHRLIETGEVREIRVERPAHMSEARWYALAEDLPALDAASGRRVASEGGTLLTPFDSFLWHRERTHRLFGFHYTIEVYTPGHKRVHGYYTLPIVHDGQLIGRVDPKVHRAERRLEIKWVHFEPWFARSGQPPAAAWGAIDRDAAIAGLADSLRSLARFVGADTVSLGQVAPASLGAPLRRQL